MEFPDWCNCATAGCRKATADVEARQGGDRIDNGHAVIHDSPENRVGTGVVTPNIEVVRRTTVIREIDEPLARRAVRVAAGLRHRDRAARIRNSGFVLDGRERQDLRRLRAVCRGPRRWRWIDGPNEAAALDKESGHGAMDETGGELAVRRIGLKVSSLVHVIQKFATVIGFCLPEKARYRTMPSDRRHPNGVAHVRIGKRRSRDRSSARALAA